MNDIANRDWFKTLAKDQQELIELSLYLYEREQSSRIVLDDYSFIIFPFAKAYEGFLKQYLLELGLISQKTFEGKRFRIGRALNPDIRQDQRDKYWLYDDIARFCGPEMTRDMWEAWLTCRNRLFHYFPLKNIQLDLPTVESYLSLLDETITNAYTCKVETLEEAEARNRR